MGNKLPIKAVPAQRPLEWLAVIFATGFGSGYSPIIPGTAGTIIAIPIYLLLVWLLRLQLFSYIAVVVLITALGCLAAHRAGRHFGRVDASPIVIDEIAGFLVGMIAIAPSWLAILIGFLLFRLFDILKPWPANYFDRKVANGFGVVMDDIAAGCYTLIILQALKYLQLF
ncbi:MAG: phosphatidylglycerophosphatase A [Acidobacteriota bacterium]